MIVERIKRKIDWLTQEHFFGLDELDRKLLPYIDKRNGFFIEAGANNGIAQSNTLFLERYRGWNGLLVEPVPALAAQCRRHRKRSTHIVNAALVAPDYQESFVLLTECNLATVTHGALSPSQQDEHIALGQASQNIAGVTAIESPAKTLTSILDNIDPPPIDLLSLDVEGAEVGALRGLDFDKYSPKWILVETAYNRDEIFSILAPYYSHVTRLTLGDDLFRARD